MCPLINTPPPPEGVIISQPILRFLGVIFDRDHDFEGPRSPKAHLDTVLSKPVTPLGHPPYYIALKYAVKSTASVLYTLKSEMDTMVVCTTSLSATVVY